MPAKRTLARWFVPAAMVASMTALLLLPSLEQTKRAPAGTRPAASAAASRALVAAGAKVFVANSCDGCHTVNGKAGGAAPDLSRIGAAPTHTAQWLEVQINSPQKHKASSAMPPYAGRIKSADMKALVAYLSSLKGTPERKADARASAAPAARAVPAAAPADAKPSPAAGADAALIAAGEKVFTANNCGMCHAVNGKGGSAAPDLTGTGAAAGHTAEWFQVQVATPQKHTPSSPMPGYAGRIKDEDMKALSAYLCSLTRPAGDAGTRAAATTGSTPAQPPAGPGTPGTAEPTNKDASPQPATGAPAARSGPALVNPGQANATYVGVTNCQMCHIDLHKSWNQKPHARAFELLVAKKQDKNGACLKCHTTGYGHGGFVDADKTPALKGVTCEACHGPGSEHNGDPNKITRVPPATVCTNCHMRANIH